MRLPLRWLSPDGRKLLVGRVFRGFAYGYLGVILALFLHALAFDEVRIGMLLAAAVAGSAAMTVMWALVADRWGRRRSAQTMALLMAAGGALFAVSSDFWPLLIGACTGTISVTSAEVGSFLTVEQAILPQTAPPEKRTWLFAVYAMISGVAQAAGSLFAGAAGLLVGFGLTGADTYRPFFALYVVIGLVNVLLFLTLSGDVELAQPASPHRFGIHRSTGTVVRLSALFGLDSFAGGFVIQPLVVYWFVTRWGFVASELGVLFFVANLLSALSLLVSGRLAARFGLIRTMVFTHLPASLMLVALPFMPSGGLAAALLLARTAMSQMDVPARQWYTMAVVDLDERTAAAGITNVARSAASALSPTLAGYAFSVAALGVPFILAGSLKTAYDLLLYRSFAALRAPGEDPGAGAG